MTGVRPIILAGPTASGKSALALRIAERDNGCVINADALQVYACWRVLTARPSAEDLTRAPHSLYGHVDCGRRYSVGAWLSDLAPVLDEARTSGRRPVIVGGTGLYLSALTEGLAYVPEIPARVRAESRALVHAGRLDVLEADLARGDPAILARIDRDNPVRVQRAWEVLVATGRGLSEWQRAAAAPLLPRSGCHCMVAVVDIPLLDNRISDRINRMIEQGALSECRAFLRTGLSRQVPSARALGAAELFAYLEGAISLQDAGAAAATATRRFAKRQRTWFRRRMADWSPIDPSAADALAAVPVT